MEQLASSIVEFILQLVSSIIGICVGGILMFLLALLQAIWSFISFPFVFLWGCVCSFFSLSCFIWWIVGILIGALCVWGIIMMYVYAAKKPKPPKTEQDKRQRVERERIVEDAIGKSQSHQEAYHETVISEKAIVPTVKTDDEFSEARKLYEAYKNLPSDLKEYMSRVLNGTNFEAFLASGCMGENVLYIWDCCYFMARSGDQNLSLMKRIFLMFADTIQKAGTAPHYRIVLPQIGDQLDKSECLPDESSAANGFVSKVLMPGIAYVNGKILHKAYVHVEKELS